MHRSGIIIFFFYWLLPSVSLWSRNMHHADAKQEIRLNLIPPSPVTDQINLDVRAGIYNNSVHSENMDVTFYLDQVNQNSILFHQKVSIKANMAEGIKFSWSTKNKEGRHLII